MSAENESPSLVQVALEELFKAHLFDAGALWADDLRSCTCGYELATEESHSAHVASVVAALAGTPAEVTPYASTNAPSCRRCAQRTRR